MFLRSIEWLGDRVKIIDQTALPHELRYRELRTLDEVVEAIKAMRVRGAPLIGVTAALGLALVATGCRGMDRGEVLARLREAAEELRRARPTAVNLSWAVERVLAAAERADDPAGAAVREAVAMMEEDVRVNMEMARVGQELIEDGDVILTHCNTGSLATVSVGTALGLIIYAHKVGKRIHVYFTETRPVLQGSRLTAYELLHAGVPATLICDSAVGHVMRTKGVKKVFVGADRVLADGTTYNKIGTYQIAVLAKELGIPFYVVAPTSSFDLSRRPGDVVIEERPDEEVTTISGVRIAPEGVKAYNPAFDETPPEYITAFVTERGIIRPPFEKNIPRVVGGG